MVWSGMVMHKRKISFVFIVDVSGSMYGQKIASVNACLRECMEEIRGFSDMGGYELKVSVMVFAEKMRLLYQDKDIMDIEVSDVVVEKGMDGFYPITSYSCLYSGLKQYFEKQAGRSYTGRTNEGDGSTYVVLMTDGKPTDPKQYEKERTQANNCMEFLKAVKYVAIADEQTEKYNDATISFVDFRAERIVRLSELPSEMRKLGMLAFADAEKQTVFGNF